MRKMLRNILTVALMMVVFTACNNNSNRITMVTEAVDRIEIVVAGSGVVTIDWGDGSEKITRTLHRDGIEIAHTYPTATMRTIIIIGDNITELDVSENQLTSLEVSRNIALTYLNCSFNQLTSLDVSRNTALTFLDCSDNQLTSLDVSKNIALEWLLCAGNQLTNLDVSKNTVLKWLFCQENQLTNLDVSKNIELILLNCSKNQLTNLDVSKNVTLACLTINGNKFSTDALNALFHTLHSNEVDIDENNFIFNNNCWVEKAIIIDRNSAGDKSIAKRKGWTFPFFY